MFSNAQWNPQSEQNMTEVNQQLDIGELITKHLKWRNKEDGSFQKDNRVL